MLLLLQLFSCQAGTSGGDLDVELPAQNRKVATPAVTGLAQQIILKLDDAWYEEDSIHAGWDKTFAYLNQKDVVGTIGVVGEKMVAGNEAYYNWLKRRSLEGHEIWNHGWCHCKPVIDGEQLAEFRGTGFAYQLDHLTKTQELIKRKLGLTLSTFGAPYNAVDADTHRALSEIEDLNVWLYSPEKWPEGMTGMQRIPAVNIEYPVHQPDFLSFKSGYDVHRDEPVLVLQGHPRSWLKPADRFDEFKKIVDFLLDEGAEFTTPSVYNMTQM